MERSVPMDRLVCGDVGYGKTEIAVRGLQSDPGRQTVAVLVPTTLLVQQHLQTFSERYAQFPSRCVRSHASRVTRRPKAVVEGLADGSIDLVIGTHRLLSKEVRFRISAVVIDEEQRFGVEHKEQLKSMRTAVDVLAMSATPIPRTSRWP